MDSLWPAVVNSYDLAFSYHSIYCRAKNDRCPLFSNFTIIYGLTSRESLTIRYHFTPGVSHSPMGPNEEARISQDSLYWFQHARKNKGLVPEKKEILQ